MRFKYLAALLSLVAISPPSVLEAQQNLSVRPMKVEADVPAGRQARVTLRVTNRHPTRSETLMLEHVALTQEENGTFSVVRPQTEDPRSALGQDTSSVDWIDLPAEEVEIAPETVRELPVLLSVPPRARGTYVSAVIVRSDAPEIPEDEDNDQRAVIGLRFGFLIPIITQIAGRPVRQDVDIADVEMAFDNGTDANGNEVREPTTRVSMTIENTGRTFSSLDPTIRVERWRGDAWQLVTRADLPDTKILPGVSLDLSADIGRRLPSGKYRLTGTLAVDGRQVPRLEKPIEFHGDTEVDSVAFDTTLKLEPPTLTMEGVPGGTRTNILRVTNPSDETIIVNASIATPPSLRNRALDDLIGEELSAARWTEVRPTKFTLRPRQRRNVRVLTGIPRSGPAHANYYADITFEGEYQDGQSAGETETRLRVRQKQLTENTKAILDKVNVSLTQTASSIVVRSRLLNVGNVHVEPDVRGALVDEEGNRALRWRMNSDGDRLIPLEGANFSSTVNLSNVEPGEYVLLVTATENEKEIASARVRIRVDVSTDGGDASAERVVAVVEDG